MYNTEDFHNVHGSSLPLSKHFKNDDPPVHLSGISYRTTYPRAACYYISIGHILGDSSQHQVVSWEYPLSL